MGAGVVAASAATASTETEKQHPRGTLTIAVDVTLPYWSTAAGVKIALLVGRGSPLTVIAIAIGATVPPVGSAMLPLNVN